MASTAYRLLSGSALRITLNIAQVAVGLLMFPFIVHTVGDRMFGMWTLVGAVIGYYSMLDLGLSSAVTRFVARAYGAGQLEDCNRVFNTSLVVYSALGLVVMSIVIGCAAFSNVFLSDPIEAETFKYVILISGVGLAISFPLRSFGGLLEAQLRYDLVTALQLLALFLGSVFTVVVLLMGYGIVAMAWVMLISGLLTKIVHIYLCKRNLPSLRFSFRYANRKTARELFSFSIFAFIGSVADTLRFQTDALVVGGFIGLVAVTHYRIASTLVHHFIQLMIAGIGVMFPIFCRQNDVESRTKYFFMTTRLSVLVASFIAFGFIVWGRPFIAAWMGPDYLDAYPILVILTCAAVLDQWQQPLPGVLFAAGKQKLYAAIASLEGLLNLVFSLLLVIPYGMIGVAIGTLIPSVLIRLVAQPLLGCRVLSISYATYMLRLGRSILNALLALIIPLIISTYMVSDSFMALTIVGAVSLLCYVVALWWLELSRDEAKVVRNTIAPMLKFGRTFD